MRTLGWLARKSLVARPLRTALTTLGIGLGVAVLVAALILNAALDASVERSVRDLLGRASLRVSALQESGLSAATITAIAGTPGVTVAAPTLERRTFPLEAPSGAAASGGAPDPLTVLGVDPAADAALHDRAITSGRWLPDTGGGAVLSEGLASGEGLSVGSTITLLGSADAGPTAFPVVGIVAATRGDADPGGRVAWIPLASAQRLFGTAGVTSVDVATAPDAPVSGVAAALDRAITAEPWILATADDLTGSLDASTVQFRLTVGLVAAIALFGGAFLIFNTMAMTVAERARDLGLLRAAGMTRGQVTRQVLGSALILGVGGVIVGLVGGVALAILAVAYLGPDGLPVALGQPAIPPVAPAIGAFFGIGVTLAAALEPALRAGRISPVAALTARLDQSADLRARLRWLLLVFLVVGAAGILLWPGATTTPLGLVGPLAIYGLFLVVALASSWLVGPLGALAGLLARPFLPIEERLTRGSLVRDRSRTVLTVGALAVALGVMVALGGVAATTRQEATAWIDDVVPGDLLLTSVRPVGLDEPVVADLAAVSGVARVSPYARFSIASDGQRLDAAAVVGSDLLADGRLTLTAGDRAMALQALDAGGSVILPQALADRLGLPLGATLRVLSGRTVLPFKVVGIAARTMPGVAGASVLVGWREATDRLGVVGADGFAVRFAPGAASTARPALEEVARGNALQPLGRDAIAGSLGAAVDRLFALFDGLGLIALVVAALGITNTLAMNVLERVRELGVLRAVGLTRSQAWRLVVLEAAVLGLVGSVLGIAAGLGAGALLVALGGGIAFTPGWGSVGAALVLGIALAMLAAAYPARRAARFAIVRAVTFD